MREAWEETGSTDLKLVGYPGLQNQNRLPYGKDEVHYRRFYHLICPGNPPATWWHYETNPRTVAPARFLLISFGSFFPAKFLRLSPTMILCFPGCKSQWFYDIVALSSHPKINI